MLHCVDSYVNVVLGKGCLLFSGGRERPGMGPYGDPCCTEQLNALSLFCPLLVVQATELAHRNREAERELALNNMLLVLFCFFTFNSNSNDTGSCSHAIK